MSFEKLESLPEKHFNKDISMIFKDLESKIQENDAIDCSSKAEECLKQEALAKLTYKMSFRPGKGVSQRFGSFLRNFVPMFFENFNMEKYHRLCFLMACKKDMCKGMTSQEKYLHNVFANLSSKLNFHKAISLHEVPSLLSFNPSELTPKKPLFVMNHRCQRDGKIIAKQFIDCSNAFIKYNNIILNQGIEAAKGNY